MNELDVLTVWAETTLWHSFLVFLRVGAIMALLPLFGEQVIPRRIRLAATLAFTAIISPAIVPFAEEAPSWANLWRYVGSEVLAGLAMGIAIRLLALTIRIAGTIAAQATSLSQLLGTAGVEPTPALGQLLVIGGLALLGIFGFHISAAEYIILSYTLFPAGAFPDASILAEWGTGVIGKVFYLAFVLSAPFVLVSTIYNLTLGVINRAMPQLMVAFIGAPLITWGGLALLWLSAPIMLSIWHDALMAFTHSPESWPDR